jgi:hypothetical protein
MALIRVGPDGTRAQYGGGDPPARVRSVRDDLNGEMILEPGCRLSDVWKLLTFDAEFYARVFCDVLEGNDLDDFLREGRQLANEREPGELPVGLELHWYGVDFDVPGSHDEEQGEDGEDDIYQGAGLRPVAGPHEDPSDIEVRFAVSRLPLCDLLPLPLTMDKLFRVRTWVGRDYRLVGANQQAFSVYQVFHAILSEVSFFGTPAQRALAVSAMDAQRHKLIAEKERLEAEAKAIEEEIKAEEQSSGDEDEDDEDRPYDDGYHFDDEDDEGEEWKRGVTA